MISKLEQVTLLKWLEIVTPSPSLFQASMWLSPLFVILTHPSPSFFSSSPASAQCYGFFLKVEFNLSLDLSEADLDQS